MGQGNRKEKLSDELKLILTQNTKYTEEQLLEMYRSYTKSAKGNNGIKTNIQFFDIAEPLSLFDSLNPQEAHLDIDQIRQLKPSPSFRVASASTDIAESGLRSEEALADPEVRRYWSDMFFHVFDGNKDGFVDFEELVMGLDAINSDNLQSKAKFLFGIIDKSNGGAIHSNELFELHDLLFRGFRASFLLTVRQQLANNPKLANVSNDDVQDLMRTIEKRIDKLEIPRLLSAQAMKMADTDHDDTISFDEYYTFVTDVRIRKACEKQAMETVAPLLDNLLAETVDLIKQKFSKSLVAPTPR